MLNPDQPSAPDSPNFGSGAVTGAARPDPNGWGLFLRLSGLLLLLQLFELPKIADWSLFAFFDPGTAFKGDVLISAGLRPAIDFGYTHGLLSLIFAHRALAILGRTPTGFILITSFLEILMAGAITLFMRAIDATKLSRLWLFCALPLAIMPAYLTLTHPLEAALLLWAIAFEARGNRRAALAICTICVFVKPSMGYVYGLLLLLLILWDFAARRANFRYLLEQTWPAIVCGVVAAAGCIWQFGWRSLALTIIPLTGLRTYADTHFGFLLGRGQRFWSPAYHGFFYYLGTPAGIWLILLGIVIYYLPGVVRRFRWRLPSPGVETLACVGIMHLCFVFGFYGWRHSWEYYSYMPVLFVAGLITLGRINRRWVAVLAVLAVVGESYTFAVVASGWKYKIRDRDTGGLWAYKRQLKEWKHVIALTADAPTLVLSNGFLPWMARGMYMPSSWFPEPGIATRREIARVGREANRAVFVVNWRYYGSKGLWHQPIFARYKSPFINLWRGKYLSVSVRRQALGTLVSGDERRLLRRTNHQASGPRSKSAKLSGVRIRPTPRDGLDDQTKP